MTEMVNPYAAPRAEVADVYDGEARVQPVKLLSSKGRIGRLRYLSYSLVGYLLFAIVVGVIVAIFASSLSSTLASLLPLLIVIPYFVFFTLLSIQRSHDMGWTGWTVLLCLIPLVSLVWVFNPGTKGVNRFGAPPPPNGVGVIIGALLLPVIAAIGILAAIALPAYQQYTVKAKAAQAAKP
ncbi:DUF805 domain-containing protein [Variovorax sp. 2RAF20]|uniref:DUF805 domain-containing protein n=1 Tax=Variovorax sp. CF313 TaxID=1144315 RepID=UPI000270F3C0|nr:DUF805 domain-containing protein [Variovorax sp. CF313]EJL72022.1 putative membrane protein [Variovorax sp. CF313]